MLFSESNKREPYRPAKYRPKTALENDSNQEEGLFGDEFEGEITNDPLEDLVDHAWAVDPNEDQVVNFEDEPIVDFEEEYEREDPITNTASRTSYKGFPYNDLQEQPFLPGHKWPTYLYRGLVITMPSDEWEELHLAVMGNDQREIYRIGKKVLNIISSKGMGRHWTTEPDVAMEFASMNAPNGNLAVVLSVVWERDGEDLATEHEGYDGVVRPSRLVGEEEVTLERGTRIKVISMKASRVDNGDLFERDFSLDLLDTPQTKTASQLVANDGVLDNLNPTGSIFVDYDPDSRASLDLAPNIVPYSETAGISPDERLKVYRGVPKGVQSELADGDFITDMKQLAQDYAGTGDVITQYVFADEVLDDTDNPMAGEYLFRPRRTSSRREANSEFPALPEDFVRNISPDGFDSRWTYETTGYKPRTSDDRYELSINPVNAPSVIPGGEENRRRNPLFYDPERTEMEWDDLFGHSPTRQDRDLSHLSPPEGLLWRGMSNEEYENAKQDGYFRSKGEWNFEGQEGETYFSTNPDAAANYANDFAPVQFKPGFGNPAHVIGIPDRPDLPRNDHEVGVPGQIPFDDVVHHYTGHPTAINPGSQTYFNDISTGEWSEGGGSAPSVSLAWEPGEGYEPKTSRREANEGNSPGNIYRGIGTDMLTQEEYDEISSWADQSEYDPSDPDSFTMVQPNYDVIQPILERLEEQQGLGRHWSKDHNVAVDFAGHNSTYFDSNEEGNPPLGIVFRGDWVGEGEDLAEEQPGYDGVVRPSNWPEEKEVTLHPGSEVNLLGVDVFEPGGDFKNIPVPDIPVYSRKKTTSRKKENVTVVNRYLRFANRRGLDPKDSRTSRFFRRANRGLSPRAMTEISSWMKAQKTAGNSARRVLANTRSYRHKMASGSWYLDKKLSAYVSKTPQKFACSCGSHIAVPSYTNCKCGKVWNAYSVKSASQGDMMFVVREVPVRENVLVANRRTASRRHNYR